MTGLDISQFKRLIVAPALQEIDLGGDAAVNLVTGTALAESCLTYVRQNPNGPALGLFQMEPATHDDCWTNYIIYRRHLTDGMRLLAGTDGPHAGLLMARLDYAAAMCRIKYLRAPAKLPAATDPAALAAYHKQHYNTEAGKADTARNTALFAQAIAA